MKTRIVGFILLAITLSIVIGLASIKINNQPITSNSAISIATSFYPLADFAQKIGGDKVKVFNITPAGTEPHDYEPTPKDLANIYNSNLFIYNGIGFEAWVDKITPDLNEKRIKIIKASDGVQVYGTTNNLDPHIWIDPVFAQQMVLNIRNGLQQVDPKNANFYQDNADKIIVELVNLDQQYQKNLNDCPQKDIITSHEAVGYIARRYRFQNFSISGLSPNEEPTPQKMAELANLVKEKKVKYILTETLVSPKLAETLAKETNISVLIFNPLEGLTEDQIKIGEDYFSVQTKNINNLSLALECPVK